METIIRLPHVNQERTPKVLSGQSEAMTTRHKEHLLDCAAVLAVRALLAVQPKLEF
jgi:hypothetical protein